MIVRSAPVFVSNTLSKPIAFKAATIFPVTGVPTGFIDLDNKLLNALIHYNIKIENKDKLLYIINNKEIAFKDILRYGDINII